MNKVLRKVKSTFKKPVKKANNPIRWGILGLGYMAEFFSSAIDGNENGVVSAVGSRSTGKAISFAKKHGCCRAYGSYEELMQDSMLDVVYIATPTKYHYENIKACLNQGKNVLCEKPITSNSKQLEELITLAKNNNCFLMEGMWMKCLPTYQKALKWVKDGKVGEVELIKADFYKREQIDPSRSIFNKNEGGGVLRDYGVYAVAFPIDFMSGKIRVSAARRNSAYGIDSDWAIQLDDGNIKASVNISSDFAGISKAAVIGTEGTIEWDDPFNRTNTITLYDAAGKRTECYQEKYLFEGFEFEINEVQQCIRNHKAQSTEVPLNTSVSVLTIMDELLR